MSDHHDHGHHGHDVYVTHYSQKDYLIGFVLAAVLTIIPFWLVMGNVLAPETTKWVILLFAGVQLIVQMVYFLHLSSKSEGGWNMMAAILTIVILVIVLAGSIWVMHHMNTNMMPGMGPNSTHDMT
ncbi:cytochrome o ubiquinol oxidase subunit IV [Massilia sp. CFBP9012]|uniref:cytochrome o ubiquinol oxidase subunit IV n=1 Tax=Massilia sp. CFBP9012 TaxID=3096531 RepID=UPI002A6B4EFB|nr:cytochrome o ubiquinol oxidase subunit IV [Massilia sp. CFBP9012]MDY0975570.1 cytochrome o ubiquinol oxidase subunit IV [Massilia sp. CFBP9012]